MWGVQGEENGTSFLGLGGVNAVVPLLLFLTAGLTQVDEDGAPICLSGLGPLFTRSRRTLNRLTISTVPAHRWVLGAGRKVELCDHQHVACASVQRSGMSSEGHGTSNQAKVSSADLHSILIEFSVDYQASFAP